ncbi:Heat shock protein 90-5, chloroplastic, partial [Cucurbita argyrosperma subsp. sororia]
TEPTLLGDAGDLEIRIQPDADSGTITITDTGIGFMTKEELIDCLGTIAQSGTSRFLKALKEDDKYEFSDPSRIQGLVKNYSQFVSFPIYTWQEKSRTVESSGQVEEEEEPKEGEGNQNQMVRRKRRQQLRSIGTGNWLMKTKPIWQLCIFLLPYSVNLLVQMRNSKEVDKDEYNEFYKKTFNEFLDPLAYTHFTTEGEVEFRSVLYIPGMGPLNNEDVVSSKTKNIRLYVKRVFISDDFDGELFPRYLSFVKGVVDSDDLPLNVSREILQESRIRNMGENQKAIYYLATDSLKSARVLHSWRSWFKKTLRNIQTYKEKKFVDISKEDLELGDEDEVEERETKQDYNLLCDWIKQQLGDKVAKVQVSKRLSSSPCVLVSGKFGWSANMERLMKAQALGDTSSLEFMRGRRILEINPDHPIVKDLNAACKNSPDSSDARRAVDLLYETALISSGFSPDSPAELGSKIYEMIAMAVGGRWGRLEENATTEDAAEADSTEAPEVQVIEPSEVRTEDDPWQNYFLCLSLNMSIDIKDVLFENCAENLYLVLFLTLALKCMQDVPTYLFMPRLQFDYPFFSMFTCSSANFVIGLGRNDSSVILYTTLNLEAKSSKANLELCSGVALWSGT